MSSRSRQQRSIRFSRHRLRAALVLVLAIAIPDRRGFAGDFWDPSGTLALPQVQNFVCQYSGALCKRQNRIRLVTLDYVQNSAAGDGWTEFTSIGSGLPAGFFPEDCLDSEQITDRLRDGNFDGNVLRITNTSSVGNFSGIWEFRPMQDWALSGQPSPVFTIEAVPQREIVFDFISSMRHEAPRDIVMTVHIQVYQDGTPRPDYEKTYQLKFRQGEDEFSNTCLLPTFGAGNYDINFLISDDLYGEDEPISVHLSVNNR